MAHVGLTVKGWCFLGQCASSLEVPLARRGPWAAFSSARESRPLPCLLILVWSCNQGERERDSGTQSSSRPCPRDRALRCTALSRHQCWWWSCWRCWSRWLGQGNWTGRAAAWASPLHSCADIPGSGSAPAWSEPSPPTARPGSSTPQRISPRRPRAGGAGGRGGG